MSQEIRSIGCSDTIQMFVDWWSNKGARVEIEIHVNERGKIFVLIEGAIVFQRNECDCRDRPKSGNMWESPFTREFI